MTIAFQGTSQAPEWGFELANLRDILRSINPGNDVDRYWQEHQHQARRAREAISA